MSLLNKSILNVALADFIVCTILLSLFFFSTPAEAQISLSGDFSPAFDGTEFFWNAGDELHIADTADGTMALQNGAQVTSSSSLVGVEQDANGFVTVDGEGSRWFASTLVLGIRGQANVDITNGALLETFSLARLGIESGAGVLTIDGNGSEWKTGAFGLFNGEINVSNGGRLTTEANFLSPATEIIGGKLSVDGPESTWETDGLLRLHQQGKLVIKNGGNVSTGSDGAFFEGLSAGEILVKGIGSKLSFVQRFGNLGNLSVTQGGFLTSDQNFSIRSGSVVNVNGLGSRMIVANMTIGSTSSNGILNVANKGLVVSEFGITLDQGSWLNLSGGTLSAETITQTSDADVFNMTGGRLVVDEFVGDLIQNGGIFTPGRSAGIAEISGNYSLRSGELNFDIFGLVRGQQYDSLDVAGNATLDGIISIDLFEEFAPELGDSFLLIEASAYSGSAFFDFSDANLAQGLRWDKSSFFSDGIIRVEAVPEPSSMALAFGALFGLLLRSRRNG